MASPEFRKSLDVIASSTRVMVKTLGAGAVSNYPEGI